jgi:hypothetical protein
VPGEPFPRGGQDSEEPIPSRPAPGHGSGPQDHPPGNGAWDQPSPAEPEQQGLFVCLPAENMELSRFGGDDQGPPMAPGPLLAMMAAAVSGGDGAGLAQVPEEVLFSVISGGRRMASWATWLEFSAMRELALRHPVVPPRRRPTRPAASAAQDGAAGSATEDGAAAQDGAAVQDVGTGAYLWRHQAAGPDPSAATWRWGPCVAANASGGARSAYRPTPGPTTLPRRARPTAGSPAAARRSPTAARSRRSW